MAFFADIDSDVELPDYSSDDSLEGMNDFEKERHRETKKLLQEMEDQRIMCCCKPHLIHDESLKYQLLYNEEAYIDDTCSPIDYLTKSDADAIIKNIKSKNDAD